jgi:hypothetical protein
MEQVDDSTHQLTDAEIADDVDCTETDQKKDEDEGEGDSSDEDEEDEAGPSNRNIEVSHSMYDSDNL